MAAFSDAMDTLEGDPAIEILKNLFRSEVEKIKQSFMQDSTNLINSEVEKNKKNLERIMTSVREKFESLKIELVREIEDKIKALKKELDSNHKKKKVDDQDDCDSKDDDEGDEGDLSDLETRLWGKSYGKSSKKKVVTDEEDEEEDDDDEEDEDEVPAPKKRGRKKGSKNKTKSKPQLKAELDRLKQKKGKNVKK